MRFLEVSRKTYTEDELRNFYISYVSNSKELHKEVPVFSRSVDLVQYDNDNDTLTAIEFKIDNWKKAIQQALDVSMCFDFLAICIPEPKTKKCLDLIEEECSKYGIGIYLYNDIESTFEHIVLEEKINDVWYKQRKTILDYIEVVNND